MLRKDYVPSYQRVDNGRVRHSIKRQTDFCHDKATHQIKVLCNSECDKKLIWKVCLFLVEDMMFNSVLEHAREALRHIANMLVNLEDARAHPSKSTWIAREMTKLLYKEKDGYFYDYDLFSRKRITPQISAGLAAAYRERNKAKDTNTILKKLLERVFPRNVLST